MQLSYLGRRGKELRMEIDIQPHFSCGYAVALALLLKFILSSFNWRGTLVTKNQLAIKVRFISILFYTLNSVPMIYIFFHIQLLHCLDYRSGNAVCFKIEKYDVIQFCSFSRLFWVLWVP